MSVLPTDEAVIEVVSPDVEKVEPRLSAADSIGTAKEHDIAQTVSSVPSSHPHPGHNYSNARLISLVVCVTGAAFLNTLSVQSFVILLPTIGRDLSIPESRQQWIMSAYALTFGCFLLLFGKLADVYGKRRVFLAGSAWLTVITIVTPFVRNEIVFDLFRGLQGLGSAANVPTAIGILGFTFPPGKAKTYAFAFYGGGAPLGSIFGTILGGVLGQWISWKWIFWILSILTATITVASYFIIPLPPTQHASQSAKRNVDWLGGLLITVGVLVLLFALTEGNVVGWSTPYIPVLIVVSVVLITAFIFLQHFLERKPSRTPLMKVSLFRSTRFSAAIAIMFLFQQSFNNYLIFVTYFYQSYQGLSPIQTTLRFIPVGIVGVLTICVMAHVLGRIPANSLLIFSALGVGIACLLFAVPVPPDTTYWAYGFPAMCIVVAAVDTLFPTLTLFVSMSLPLEDQALGGGLINAVGQIGRAVGLAIATAIQVAVIAYRKGVSVDDVGTAQTDVRDPALLSGLRAAQWFSVGTATAALAVVMFAFRGAGIIGKK